MAAICMASPKIIPGSYFQISPPNIAHLSRVSFVCVCVCCILQSAIKLCFKMYFKIVYPGCPNVHNIKSAQLGSEILGIPGKVKKKKSHYI